MTELEKKFGFPFFSKVSSNVYLGNHKKLVISDIWAFWDYIIKKANYDREFMGSLLEQAKTFYLAAETSPTKSKPLLYYYAFLNFSKIVINLEKRYGKCKYAHGIGEAHHNKFSHSTITVLQKKTSVVNVSCELREVLDNIPLTVAEVIKVKDYLIHCVGVHRTYSEVYNTSEVFIRLEDIKFFKNGKTLVSQAKVCCDQPTSVLLTALGYNIRYSDDEGFIWEESVVMPNYTVTRDSICRLSTLMRGKGMWYYLNDKGYTAYISTHADNRYSTETIIYNTMFFLGSITRYHPYMFDKIFSERDQWLMSEFLTTQPKQFLYLTTAKVLGQDVLKAYSSF